MISKSKVQNIINKYYLDLNEQVTWEIKDRELSIDFMSPSKDLIGNITCEDFDLENCSLPIFETKKLASLINICSGDLVLELDKEYEIISKLKISDKDFSLSYSLADSLLIGRTGRVESPDEWDITISLTKEDIRNLVKAKGALLDVDNMLIKSFKTEDQTPVCKFIFGDESGYSNKITYQIPGVMTDFDIEIPFSSTIFRSILKSNKEADEGHILIFAEGLMKLEFVEEGIKSNYFLVRKAETNF